MSTTQSYTLSLHDALPIFIRAGQFVEFGELLDPSVSLLEFEAAVVQHLAHRTAVETHERTLSDAQDADRKSTRLNSSHQIISYAVFCLKKKNEFELLCKDA